MCRYAFQPYKSHYACFRCRKQFKRRRLEDIENGGKDRPARCPQCGLLMADMGLDFKPPPKRDEKAWKRIEVLYEVGTTFHSCGCGGPGYRPADPVALRAFLEERRAYFQTCVRQSRESPGYGPEVRADAVATWQSRVADVDAALADLGR